MDLCQFILNFYFQAIALEVNYCLFRETIYGHTDSYIEK